MHRPLVAAARLTRPRITERLTRATRFPVTLVAAPAGFGKSVALSDFVASARLDVLRYDVGRGDATLLAFVRGLATTVQPVAPSALAAFPGVQERVLATRDPARELAEWFVEHVKRNVCTIVVDDLHYASSDALAFLVAVVERTSERIAWILATRSDAALPVASWIGYGRMDIAIGEDELRFTADEALAAAFEIGADLDAGEIEALRELTGGWPIAMAIALRARAYSANLPSAASGTREMVYRYLTEQVFAGPARPQQRFLLASSVFTSFDLALAEALDATPAFVEELRHDATFMTEIAPGVYRYHDLFRDFLERELRRCGAAEWFRVHCDGAALLERRGDDAGALALLRAAGATEAIVSILTRRGFALVEHGEADAVAAALEVVPEAQRRESAALLGLGAVLDGSRGRFDVAEPSFIAAIARAQESALRIALVGRYAVALVRQGRDCIALLEPCANDEGIPLPLRVPILGTLATAYVSLGRIDDAQATIGAALERLDAVGDEIRARVYQQAAYVRQFVRGREDAHLFATRAAELALACGLYDVAARAYSILYTLVYDEEDDPLAVLAVLEKLGDCARKGASRQARLFGVIAAYEMEAERGDEEALARLERDLEGSEDALPLTATETLRPARALRAAWSGGFQTAYALLEGSGEQQRSDERRALRHAEIALYAYAAGRHVCGDAAVAAAIASLGSARPGRRVVRSHLVLALALLVAGKAAAAYRHLGEAEALLLPEMRRLRALAHVVRALYRVQLGIEDRSIIPAALEQLRAEHGGGVARLIEAAPFVAEHRALAVLTPAERAILALLVRGASSKEIAARTKRSAQTVDTHIRSICRKLNCSGRREAVALAIGAGLAVTRDG